MSTRNTVLTLSAIAGIVAVVVQANQRTATTQTDTLKRILEDPDALNPEYMTDDTIKAVLRFLVEQDVLSEADVGLALEDPKFMDRVREEIADPTGSGISSDELRLHGDVIASRILKERRLHRVGLGQ